MKYNISAVPATLIDVVWPNIVDMVREVVKRAHGEITEESVYNKLLSGNTLLITISDGPDIIAINTVEVRTFETGLKALYIPITSGSHLDDWMPDFLEAAKGIARDFGCTELRGIAVRPGWLKKLKKEGWEPVHTVIKCDVGADVPVEDTNLKVVA